MAKVARICVGEFKNKFFKKIDYSYFDISGVEILDITIKAEKYKNRLNKFLKKNGVKYAVAPFDTDVASVYGKELIRNIYPEIIKRYAKTYAGCLSVSVYSDRLDEMARSVIFDLCDKFKYISVFTSDYNKDKFFDEVLSVKGVMPLSVSENENEPTFVLSGDLPGRKNIVDLRCGTDIKIYTPDKKVISSALCEAVIKAKSKGESDMREEFLRLGYKVI